VRELSDLLADDAGRALLQERGMHTDPGAFAALLSPPPDGALNELLGLSAQPSNRFRSIRMCLGGVSTLSWVVSIDCDRIR